MSSLTSVSKLYRAIAFELYFSKTALQRNLICSSIDVTNINCD